MSKFVNQVFLSLNGISLKLLFFLCWLSWVLFCLLKNILIFKFVLLLPLCVCVCQVSVVPVEAKRKDEWGVEKSSAISDNKMSGFPAQKPEEHGYPLSRL